MAVISEERFRPLTAVTPCSATYSTTWEEGEIPNPSAKSA